MNTQRKQCAQGNILQPYALQVIKHYKHDKTEWAKKFVSCLLIAILLPITSVAGQVSPQQDPSPAKFSKSPSLVSVVSPTEGDTIQGKSVAIILEISTKANRRSIAVSLNGKDVTSSFRDAGPCLGVRTCTATGAFSLKDGLKDGMNRLVVSAKETKAYAVKDWNSRSETKRLEFNWKASTDLDLTDPAALQLTPSVAFTTVAPGGQKPGQPWIQIYSNALNGGTRTFPQSTDTTCATNYQVLQLDRKTLKEISYACANDSASLKTILQGFKPSNSSQAPGDLIIVGTPWDYNAASGLDTTAIGGTNYTNTANYPSSQYPLGYMIVGVGGASAGQAYEHYYVNPGTDPGTANYPQLTGVLTRDPQGNYAYHPSDNDLYSVDATHSTITVNGVQYTPPADANPGFWLLALHRFTLANEHGCTSKDGGKTFPQCGEAFATNTSAGIDSLTKALTTLNPRDLIFLVSVGSPFNTLARPSSPLAFVVEALGGSGYTLDKLAAASDKTPTYTLISSSDPQFSKSFLGGNSVVSTNIAANQSQTGSVYGVLARDLHGLYRPVNTTQGSIDATAKPVDNSFFQLAWTQPGSWPLMDTDGHLGAYRYLSYWTIYNASNGNTKADDIRALYPTSSNGDIAGKDPTQAPYPNGGNWADVVDGHTYPFTNDEMNDVAKQLKNELFDLETVSKYMYVSNGGLKNAITNSSSGIVYTLLQAASAATTDLSQEPSSTPVTVNFSNVWNLLGSLFSIGAALAEPETQPVLGLFSGILWGAGSVGVINPGSAATPPNPYITISTDVKTLAGATAQYINNFAESFDQSMDNINTDWTKLNQVAINTGINGSWQLPSATTYDNLQPIFQQAAKTYFYTQIFASIYSLDTFTTTVNQPWLLGSGRFEGECPYCYTYCRAIYPNTSSSPNIQPYAVYPTSGSPLPVNDILYVGGALSKNNTGNMSEKYPSSDYLNTLFGTDVKGHDLNLPSDQFWSRNGPLTRRSGNNAPGFSENSVCTNIGQRVR